MSERFQTSKPVPKYEELGIEYRQYYRGPLTCHDQEITVHLHTDSRTHRCRPIKNDLRDAYPQTDEQVARAEMETLEISTHLLADIQLLD